MKQMTASLSQAAGRFLSRSRVVAHSSRLVTRVATWAAVSSVPTEGRTRMGAAAPPTVFELTARLLSKARADSIWADCRGSLHPVLVLTLRDP